MSPQRLAVLAVAVVAALAPAASAHAAVTTVLGSVTCTPQADQVRFCAGIAPSFDGTPVDVNVALPPAPAAGPDGAYPLIGVYHGWGSTKLGLTNSFAGRTMDDWAKRGYVVFSMSDRGWGGT